MPKRLAILGWGSLLWDRCPQFDNQHREWLFDGPSLKPEFSRVSQSPHNVLTLVIDPKNGVRCEVAYALSKRTDPEDALCDLRCREATTRNNIGYVYTDGSEAHAFDAESLNVIRAWAERKGLDVVFWTDLASNFRDRCGKPFTVSNAIAHVKALSAEGKARAAEYVWRAPPFVDTPLRRTL